MFTAIFATEAALKILALGLFNYLKDKWNCFDVVIVFLSLIELGLSNVKGLTILRSFRLVCYICLLFRLLKQELKRMNVKNENFSVAISNMEIKICQCEIEFLKSSLSVAGIRRYVVGESLCCQHWFILGLKVTVGFLSLL